MNKLTMNINGADCDMKNFGVICVFTVFFCIITAMSAFKAIEKIKETESWVKYGIICGLSLGTDIILAVILASSI